MHWKRSTRGREEGFKEKCSLSNLIFEKRKGVYSKSESEYSNSLYHLGIDKAQIWSTYLKLW